MKIYRITGILWALIAGMLGLPAQGGPLAVAANGGYSYNETGVEVLTRGPVHEAFAEPNNSYSPTQGIVVPMDVPAAIEEIPPDERPTGDAVWIPGYWQWDDERGDFIWISGIWRVPPPGCGWVPGYWIDVSDGWTWTPGFWMTSETDELTYLPQPPNSLENGPSGPAPAADYIWTPGCWLWTQAGNPWWPWSRPQARYAWRPGYWAQARPDWVWSPAYYVNTPHGSVFIDGYWDWTIGRRGVLFAPVYIRRSTWERPNYVYSPSIVIQIDLFTVHLFIRPSYDHYYFGDYYGEEYSRGGFHPWFERRENNRGYDPIYAHERWSRSRADSHWEERVREDYDFRRRNIEARPSRTYATQGAFASRAPERERNNIRIAAPLSEVTKRRDTPIRYEKVSEDRRKSIGEQGKDLAKYRDQRKQWESPERPTSRVKPTQTVQRKPQESRAPSGKPSGRPGETQSDPSSQRPVRVQPDRSTREPVLQAQPDRSSKEPVQVQPDRAPKRQGETPTVQSRVRESDPKPPQITEPRKQKIPRSPVVGKRVDTRNQDGNPPGKPKGPKPDTKIQSKPTERDKTKPEASRTPAPSESKNREKDAKSREKR